MARAWQLRDRAQNDKTIEKPDYPAILQLMLAAELGDTQTFTKIADSWKQLNPDERASQELEGLPGITRVFRTEPATLWQLRAGASRAAIDDYANLLLRQPDLMRKFSQTLSALLAYYDAHDATKSRALVTALAAQIAVAGAREDIDSWNSSLAVVAAQERDAGHAALAAPIVGALVAHTPENFHPFQAVAFMEAGFAEAARQTFEPLQRLRQEQDLHKRINETTDETAKGRLQRQQNSFDWGYYAENEARYLAPDAPAAWFDAIEDPQQRVKVLQGWSIGLSPQLKLSPPYVKYTSSNGGVGIETKSTS